MSNVVIEPVTTRKGLTEYIKFPFKLYKDIAIKARLSGSQDDYINRPMFNHLYVPPIFSVFLVFGGARPVQIPTISFLRCGFWVIWHLFAVMVSADVAHNIRSDAKPEPDPIKAG